MSRNILDPAALIAALPSVIPPANKILRNPHDALAALIHTAMSVLGFRLIAVDDSPSRNDLNNVLPNDWNKNGPGDYTFKYKHDQSSLEFVLKVSKLGNRTLFNAIAVESDKAASLDISTNDFTSPSFFPYDLGVASAEPLVHGFISSYRIADLMSQFQIMIIQRLVPGLRKEGYTEISGDSSTNAGGVPPPRGEEPQPSRPQPVTPPYAPSRYPQPNYPPENPLEIGRRDLEPFPRNPFAPPSLFPDNNGDGMFVGPDHPIFGRYMRGPGGDNRGPWGGDGWLPPMGAPPGARFDPVGPGLGPFPGGPIPGRGGPGGPGAQGGGPSVGPGRNLPGRGNMQDPDNDEFMPPGMGDMFS